MAAWHYLRDYYSCGRIGERRGLNLEQLVRRYYAYDVKDLEYFIIEFPSDTDLEDLADLIFDYIWFQDNIPKSFFNHKESWEVGIGCSGSNYRFTKEKTVVCMFVYAQKMVNKKIIENIPNFSYDISSDSDSLLSDECLYAVNKGYLEMFRGINLIEAFVSNDKSSFPSSVM